MSTTQTQFKNSEAGLIPQDWEVKRIGDFLKFFSGKAHEQHISPAGRYVVVNSKFISSDGRVRKYSTKNFLSARIGDVLMVMSDLPNGRALAKCFLVDHNDFYAVNQRVCILRTRNDDPRYLRYVLNRNPYFMAFDDGVQQTHLLNDPIKNCPVVLPKFNEQLAIADVLEDSDSLIAALERLIAKKQWIKQGMMQQLLSGKTRLPGFSANWRTIVLGDVLKVRHGRNQQGVEHAAGQYPILATGGQIGRTNTPLYSRPSVLIGRKGTIDRPQYRDEPFWTVDTLFYTEIADSMVPKFLYYQFLMVDWRSKNEASGVPSLNARAIENVQVRVPEREEQQAITDVLSDADAEIQSLRRRLTKAKSLKHGMMQELLTGRTRLPTEAAA
ncbi:restriction endonuclease subunit S [Arthrobacter sp. fls2-241-R2A-200]|uniref:restriction endonuclease subunit S n=1 Tax=Arthrobacter sp. fls2-241-R2A-200 TaxID=3040281 RepID=UPI00254D462E|nr:restriction endonuclease subunit S [Arthrobacter sp. fls2-241-R2A-200]